MEEEFVAYVGAQGAVATGFGRSALLLALEALGVRGGDVLVPDFVCAQVPEAVRRAGGQPLFYPVRRSLRIDPDDFQSSFTAQTRAAIAVHYFGQLLPELPQLAAISGERGVPLVEDGALALGATLDGGRVGAFGGLSVFSLTKTDWCYGGGMVTSNSPALLARLRSLRGKEFQPCSALLFRYGLLRRADFACNRPSLSRAAERAGVWLEGVSGLGEGNFYDAGRFDATLPAFAARRARRLQANLSATTARRQQILRRLTKALSGAGQMLLRPDADPGDSGSFLLVQCPDDRAEDWVEEATCNGVTLRRCWPAYQPFDDAQASPDVGWLAEHLLVLEIHPQLSADEIEKIVQTLRSLGSSHRSVRARL